MAGRNTLFGKGIVMKKRNRKKRKETVDLSDALPLHLGMVGGE
jgi:hypothetical protein